MQSLQFDDFLQFCGLSPRRFEISAMANSFSSIFPCNLHHGVGTKSRRGGEGGGVLPCMGFIGMSSPCGFSAVLVEIGNQFWRCILL